MDGRGAVRCGGRVENRHHYCDRRGDERRRERERESSPPPPDYVENSTADSSRASIQYVARLTDATNLSVLARARSRRSPAGRAVLRPSGSPQDTPLIGARAIWSYTGCS